MANEIQFRSGLTIRNGNLDYSSRPNSGLLDQSLVGGPSPGEVLALQTGTLVDFSALTSPGACWLQNLDSTNWVEVGAWDPDHSEFFPLLELPPGVPMPVFLSRYLGYEMDMGAGTGTVGSGVRLMLKGVDGACRVRVDAFER